MKGRHLRLSAVLVSGLFFAALSPVPRDAAVPSPRLSPNLLASVEAHQEELLRALTRI